MKELLAKTKSFMQEEEGATAVEYGVMIALIIAVAVIIIAVLGRQVRVGFETVSNELTNAGITDPGTGGGGGGG